MSAAWFTSSGKKTSPNGAETNGSALVVTIGRSRDNALVLDGKTIADRHAEVIVRGQLHYLRDLGSRYGTKVNGQPITVARLQPGETVTFGDDEYSFEFSLEDDSLLADAVAPSSEDIISLSDLPRARALDCEKTPKIDAPEVVVIDSPAVSSDADTKAPAKISRSRFDVRPLLQKKAKELEDAYRVLQSTWFGPFLKPVAIICVTIIFGLLTAHYNDMARKGEAYDFGFATGMKEFSRPPRNLNTTMVLRLGKPAAARLDIQEKEFQEFLLGMKAAIYQTYYRRYQKTPRLG